jgi:hypothetical protein
MYYVISILSRSLNDQKFKVGGYARAFGLAYHQNENAIPNGRSDLYEAFVKAGLVHKSGPCGKRSSGVLDSWPRPRLPRER